MVRKWLYVAIFGAFSVAACSTVTTDSAPVQATGAVTPATERPASDWTESVDKLRSLLTSAHVAQKCGFLSREETADFVAAAKAVEDGLRTHAGDRPVRLAREDAERRIKVPEQVACNQASRGRLNFSLRDVERIQRLLKS